MNLLQRFTDFIQRQKLFSAKDTLLLAVSGGVDSVVLCELCKQAGYDFIILHCNFQLRGEESERDEQFVRSLGEKYKVEVKVKKFDTTKYAEENKIGIQEAARNLRYGWFEELVSNLKSEIRIPKLESRISNLEIRIPHPASRISYPESSLHLLTAHHADDNAETVLMSFCRGTGLKGLEGIPVLSNYIRRPLLAFRKEELIGFAKENKLGFVEDSSNVSSKYTRNLFRNEIIPLISKAYPQVKENLLNNIHRFKEINHLYHISVSEIKKKLLKVKNGEIHIPVKQLMSYQNHALIFEIISEYGFTEKQVEEVVKLANSDSGKFIQAPNSDFRIIKFRNWLIISSLNSESSETIVIEEGTKTVQTPTFQLQFSTTADCQLPTDNLVACLDAKEITFPLILRKWKQGDYFYPLGMPKKKKLSRFFIDQKLSKTEREKTWVLEMNKKILWVVGLRIDDRFKITERTKKVLKISLETA
jgi:tRNA(Ile)-lysidine synthase